MKVLNLFALDQVTFDEAISMTTWLQTLPTGAISLPRLQSANIIRQSKIPPMIKILTQFCFIANNQSRLEITGPGRNFVQCDSSTKRKAIRLHLSGDVRVQKIMELLKTSPTGRIKKDTITELVSPGLKVAISTTEVKGLITWAQAVDLFYYDPKLDEIFAVPGTPYPGPANDARPDRGNRVQNLRLVS